MDTLVPAATLVPSTPRQQPPIPFGTLDAVLARPHQQPVPPRSTQDHSAPFGQPGAVTSIPLDAIDPGIFKPRDIRVQGAPMLPRFDILRGTAHTGRFIPTHRALATQRLSTFTGVFSLLAGCAGSLLMILLMPSISAFWTRTLGWIAQCILPGTAMVEMRNHLMPFVDVQVPAITVAAGAPTGMQWLNGAVFAVGLFLVSFLLPHRARPLGYLVRFAALIQLSAEAYFYFVPGRFPYTIQSHLFTLFTGTALLILITPLLHALIYFPYGHSWWRKLMLSSMSAAYLALLAPLDFALHAWLIAHGSLVVQPLLFLMFGFPVEVFILVCFYGWAMGWERGR